MKLKRAPGFLAALAAVSLFAAAPAGDPLLDPARRLAPEAAEWRALAAEFAREPEATADFEERRVFPFRDQPVVLRGEVRVSHAHGLSLHYTVPEVRTIIVDDRGTVLRERSGDKTPPRDPRAAAANDAMRHILRMDLAALAPAFELFGQRDGETWRLALVPREESVRRAIGNIFVSGRGGAVSRIELRRSERQRIEIAMSPPRPGAFDADELKRFFR